MHLCLFEDHQVPNFFPLTQTRGVYQLRTGALTNLLRLWDIFEKPAMSLHARQHMAALIENQISLPVNQFPDEQGILFINGRITGISPKLVAQFKQLAYKNEKGRVFLQGEDVVAAWVPKLAMVQFSDQLDRSSFEGLPEESVTGARFISRLWHLIDGLQERLRHDVSFMMGMEKAVPIGSLHKSITLIKPADIFISRDARIHAGAILNASDGPIYIDRQAQVMEAALLKGPLYLGQKSVIKARADVSKSALGPVCKAGGEVTESVLQSFSNKAHEGFLGHAYLGSWCNIGAGTHASNLKNDYGETTLFNQATGEYEKTGRQFLGVIMGDHSKLGISSMVNTASIIGVGCNLFGSGFLPRYLPAFSWGSPMAGFEPYRLDKAFEAMRRVMARRNRELSEEMVAQLEAIFRETHHTDALQVAGF